MARRIDPHDDLLTSGISGDCLAGINQACEQRWRVWVWTYDAEFHKQVTCSRLAALADVTGRETCQAALIFNKDRFPQVLLSDCTDLGGQIQAIKDLAGERRTL